MYPLDSRTKGDKQGLLFRVRFGLAWNGDTVRGFNINTDIFGPDINIKDFGCVPILKEEINKKRKKIITQKKPQKNSVKKKTS